MIYLIDLVTDQIESINNIVKLKSYVEIRYYKLGDLVIYADGTVSKEKHNNKTGYYVFDGSLQSLYPIGSRYLEVASELVARDLAKFI